jgi:Ser/Thr protein kinase RdoA (MazF antagonist)
MKSSEWIDIALLACADAGVQPLPIETIFTWDQRGCANAVYRISGNNYLKVFGPGAEWQFHVECSVLKTVEEHSDIPAPRIITKGEISIGHPYLMVTGVPGSTAEDIWDKLPRREQIRIAQDLGRMTRAIHDLPQQDLALVEKQFGGLKEHNQRYRDRHVPNIMSNDLISTEQCDDLIQFIDVEAQRHLNETKVLTHFDLAHNHIYLSKNKNRMEISGIIDWGESTLGPAEWDISYLWFWTFSRDSEAMHECLTAYYEGNQKPKRFARRCLASVFYTSSMALLWPDFLQNGHIRDPIVSELTKFLFPPELFGPDT